MTYSQTLDFLYSQLPMYQRVGNQAFKKGLGNTEALLTALGNPEASYPCIHIAGTNGKGTVAHLLSAAYQKAGFKVGLYTSPHYRDFRERFKVNGKMVSKKYVSGFVEDISSVIEQVKPSFFEITVALAFKAFADARVDIAIIETGLGGRLDSTNVITPVTSVITNISFDHMEMLGDTLPKIATEKAGIIKPGVPVVIGVEQDESADVFRNAADAANATITFADAIVGVANAVTEIDKTGCDLRIDDQSHSFHVPNGGGSMTENMRTALWAVKVTGRENPALSIDVQDIAGAWANLSSLTGYKGRWQLITKEPLVIADSAHNASGLKRVVSRLESWDKGQLHMVFGVVREKALDDLMDMLPRHAIYYYCKPDVPRGLDAEELSKVGQRHGLSGKHYTSVRKALAAAKKRASDDDLVFVGGSTFVVAEVV